MPMVVNYPLRQRAPQPSAVLDLDDTSVSLWLPSSLTIGDRMQLLSSDKPASNILITHETSLRIAILQDCLDSIKRLLRSKVSTKEFKKRNIFGQKGNTRARTAVTRLDAKTGECHALWRGGAACAPARERRARIPQC